MCGISGCILYRGVNVVPPMKEIISVMNKKLNHRGPDDSGVWMDEAGKVGLGQTRLSILDLSLAGHQPMKDISKGNVITFNGEVFNFRDINDTYFKNEIFKSNTDTETLLKLYSKFNISMLEKLNGMFAFGLWDNEKEELILARDPSGKKPLYYTETGGIFVFASELKAILALPWIKPELDEEAFYDFLTFDKVITPSTMFKNIMKFEPGYFMRVDKKGIIEYAPYYQLEKKDLEFSNEKELQDIIYNKLSESVKYRMIADVPVGAFLSGGVDSSAIVALMRDNASEEIKTFTIGFEEQPAYNELEYAEMISKRYNTNHFVKMITPADLLDFIPKITEIYDEPQADTTSIPIYFISKLAKEQGIKVALNGDGPDELFAGYNNYLRYIKYNDFFNNAKKLPGFIKQGIRRTSGLYNKASPMYEMACRIENGQDFYWPGAGSIKEGTKMELLSNDFADRAKNFNSYSQVEKLIDKFKIFSEEDTSSDFISWLCFSGYKHAVIERFLFRADRLGMANSIELRSPFLNYEMIEIALSVPGEYKIRNGVPKYILKKALERLLPDEILYRKKMGFCLPVREWAGETIYNYVDQNINQFCKETGLLNALAVKQKLRMLKDGNEDQTNSIWTIFFLMNWFKKWF